MYMVLIKTTRKRLNKEWFFFTNYRVRYDKFRTEIIYLKSMYLAVRMKIIFELNMRSKHICVLPIEAYM